MVAEPRGPGIQLAIARRAIAFLCCATVAVLPASAGGAPVPVVDAATFAAALAAAKGGETIALADGTYPALLVKNRAFPETVRIVGSRGAKLAGITFSGVTNVALEGVTLTPPAAARAIVSVENGSKRITIEQVLVDGRSEEVGAGILIDADTEDVTVRGSELTNCGRGERCLSPGATRLLVEGNSFHDCLGCDFIRGGGNGGIVRGNSFERAVPGTCEGDHCPHNDHIQILGGGPWLIEGNRFGERRVGAASVYVNTGIHNEANPIHDVTIASNVFAGAGGLYGVRLAAGDGDGAGPPQRLAVVNNTILSGSIAGVFVAVAWADAPPETRPLVANNVIATQKQGSCANGRFRSNLVFSGGCPGDEQGAGKLGGDGQPTADSLLVVDRGDPTYAPAHDYFGRPRIGLPDRGAFEFVPLQAPAPGGPAPAPSEPIGTPTPPLVQPPTRPATPTPAPAAGLAVVGPIRVGTPRAGDVLAARLLVVGRGTGRRVTSGRVTCRATVAGRALRATTHGFRAGAAVCAWKLPTGARGKLLRGSVRAHALGFVATRSFVRRVR